MIVTVANFKGGVGKTMSSVHLAAYLQQKAPTLLIDGDSNRSALAYSRRGELPFKVVDERSAARYVRDFKHIVIDTEARPEEEDLKALVDGCDLLVVPTSPDAMAIHATLLTVEALRRIEAKKYKILLTICPPPPSHDAEEARSIIRAQKLPVFGVEVRRRAAFQKASLAGVPVYEVKDPRAAAAWDDYVQIAKEILK